MQNFRVVRWAAWAPGLEDQEAWRSWFVRPELQRLQEGAIQPELKEMPAIARRRIDPLGRAALQAAYWAEGDTPTSGPVIFASRWGEIARSLVLLQQLARGEDLSPTQFSLSVHNANGAQYSMARCDHKNYLAVSAGEHSAEAGVCEAMGLLADGASQVLLVCFDQPLPKAYAAFNQTGSLSSLCAWACVLEQADERGGLSLTPLPGTPQLAHRLKKTTAAGALAVLGFLIDPTVPLKRLGPKGGWLWSRTSV